MVSIFPPTSQVNIILDKLCGMLPARFLIPMSKAGDADPGLAFIGYAFSDGHKQACISAAKAKKSIRKYEMPSKLLAFTEIVLGLIQVSCWCSYCPSTSLHAKKHIAYALPV